MFGDQVPQELSLPAPSASAMYISADEGPIRFMSMMPFDPEPGAEPNGRGS